MRRAPHRGFSASERPPRHGIFDMATELMKGAPPLHLLESRLYAMVWVPEPGWIAITNGCAIVAVPGECEPTGDEDIRAAVVEPLMVESAGGFETTVGKLAEAARGVLVDDGGVESPTLALDREIGLEIAGVVVEARRLLAALKIAWGVLLNSEYYRRTDVGGNVLVEVVHLARPASMPPERAPSNAGLTTVPAVRVSNALARVVVVGLRDTEPLRSFNG